MNKRREKYVKIKLYPQNNISLPTDSNKHCVTSTDFKENLELTFDLNSNGKAFCLENRKLIFPKLCQQMAELW